MAKITDPDSLNVGTEITFNLGARTFTLIGAGNLVAKDGVTGNALWSKFVDLWTDPTYQPYPFPMNKVDARSGQYAFGVDPYGGYNGWKPANDTTRQMIRDAGWSEYSAAGALNRQYVAAIALASGYPAGAQFYFQRAAAGPAADFTFTDAPNEAIQVYGDATNGNFDERTYFKLFCREQGYTFDDAVLADVSETATGAYKVQLPISVQADQKITAGDGSMSSAPYSGVTVEYFGSNQSKTIGSGSYPFRVVVSNTGGATLAQVYTKLQYLLRQNTDIDSGAGSVTGKTADALCYFIGDRLYTTLGVYIDNVAPSEQDNITMVDQNGVQRTYPYSSAGTISFNSVLQSGAAGTYKAYFSTLPGAGNDYGEAGAVVVNDKDGNPIQGTINAASKTFTFDYDANAQGGRTPATDAAIKILANTPGYAKPIVVDATITRSKTLAFTVAAAADPDYIA